MRQLITLVLFVSTLAGCRFSRVTVNDFVRSLDTSWIEPGTTTREDIRKRLGMCPSSREGGGITPDSYRWVAIDSHIETLEAGYIVTPTFERGTTHFAEDILILFDDRGVVSLLSRTRSSDGKKLEIVDWKEITR